VKLPEMKTGLTISAIVHAALLVWGLVSFAARPLEAKSPEGLPVDIISDKQFSEMTKGVKTGAKDVKPAPLVEKIGDPKPVEDPSAKVNEKREVKAAKVDAEPPPPAPEPKPEPKEAKKEPPKPDTFKPDVIAETLKKEEAKKKAEDKAKAKQAQQQTKPVTNFDPTKIAALLDKREPQRQASTGETLNSAPSLGYVNGAAAQLSQSEIDALRRRLAECWNVPAGATNAGQLKVVLRVLLKRDGSVSAAPQLVAGTASNFGPAMAESAKRAILTCQPFTMLKAEHYDQWKDMEITFDPREMFGGG
jgi:outer membrane biosynthesis protein TonB